MNPIKGRIVPAIPAHVVIIPHGSDVVEFRHGTWHSKSVFLTDESEGGILYKICVAIDGKASIPEISKSIGISADVVSDVVDSLVGLRLAVLDPSHLLNVGTAAILGHQSIEIKIKEVVLLGESETSNMLFDALNPLLSGQDVLVSQAPVDTLKKCSEAGKTYDSLERQRIVDSLSWMQNKFFIYCSSRINPVATKGLNLCLLEHKSPWLNAALDGPFLLVGPLFIPGESACYECFETRIGMNLRDAKGYADYKQALALGLPTISHTSLLDKLLLQVLTGHVAIEAFNFLVSSRSALLDKMLAIHLPTMEFSYHEVLRMPYCSACGASPDRDASELYFSIKELFAPGRTS